MSPRAISEDGTILGWSAVALGQGGEKNFVWKAGILQQLPVIHVIDAFLYPYAPRDINSNGEIASSGVLNSNTVAVRYRPIMRMAGDTNCDFVVNVTDLLAVINRWGQSGVHEDVNADFSVNVTDLLMVISNWG